MEFMIAKRLQKFNLLSMRNAVVELKRLIEEVEDDFSRYYDKRNKTAGRRIRHNMQLVKKLAQEVRMDILKRKNGIL